MPPALAKLNPFWLRIVRTENSWLDVIAEAGSVVPRARLIAPSVDRRSTWAVACAPLALHASTALLVVSLPRSTLVAGSQI